MTTPNPSPDKFVRLSRPAVPVVRLAAERAPAAPPPSTGAWERLSRPALPVVALMPEPVGAAETFIRQHLVSRASGRPLARLSALVNEAARIAETRVVLADETGTANRDVWRRLGAVLAGVCAEVPDAALDPELFETFHTILLLWAVGQDLADSFQHQPQVQPFLGAYHREVRAIFQALAC